MLLTDDQVARLEAEALRLLEDVGLRVETDEIADILQKRGCKPLANGRLRIPRELTSEVIAVQRERLASGEEFTHLRKRFGREGPSVVIPSAFSHGPTRYYDFETGRTVDATPEIGDDMIRLAEATPEVAGVQPFWVRGERPEVQSVERLVRALKLSRHIAPMDVMHPGEHKFMIEIGEIITGQPLQFVLPGQCMTPPLTLCDRAGQSYVELAKLGIRETCVATMTNIGVSAPVTCWGAVVQAAAEILAGWVAVYCIWTESRLRAAVYVVSIDMATGQSTMVSPEMAWVNAATKELFNRLVDGQVAGTGTQYGPNSMEPGFQAVCENIYMAYAAARLEGKPARYLGAGQLAMGGVGCPEQLMLDIEAARAMRAVERPAPPMNDETLALDAMREVFAEGRTFLDDDHTLAHFRDLWRPQLIRWDGTESGSERAVLERAREMWRNNLSRYEPPGWPDDVLRALERVRQAARRELLGE